MRFWLCLIAIAVLATTFPASPAAAGSVGKQIADYTLPDHVGKEHSLSDFADSKLVVVAFLGTECPLAKLYAGRLQKLADEYSARGVAFMAVDSNRQDSLTEIAAYVRRHEVKYPVLKDRGNQVADLFGAERTPQVFLLDTDRKVRYVGRVDDQYVIGIVRDKPSREDLRIALDELLADKPVSTTETKALGCIIGRSRKPDDTSSVTYSRDIAPILQNRCVECHREGEIGPFELANYDDVAGWGEMIAEVVRDRRMPPWHADPHHGSFENDRSMTEAEKKLIYKWVENGCPEGDPSNLPEPRTYTTGWQLPREPDVVFQMDKPFTVPADAGQRGVPYQYFRVPTGFTEDKWVEGTEVHPGNRLVVHHTIVYAEPPGGRRRRDWIFLSAYVPGLRYSPLPEGAAKRIPAGSDLIFEQHYTPVGSEQTDVTGIGVIFADVDKITHEVITTEVGNLGFRIPARDSNHVVTGTSRAVNKPMTLLSMSPHMHLRGKAFRYELVMPNGKREILLDVPRYDFNWQTRYLLKQPRELPEGAVIHCRAAYDNSAKNLANPDPNVDVRWGDQSWEEMMLGFFDVLVPRDDTRRAGKKPLTTGLDVVGMFDEADADDSGDLAREETKGHRVIYNRYDAIDKNDDKRLDLGEVMQAIQAAARLGR